MVGRAFAVPSVVFLPAAASRAPAFSHRGNLGVGLAVFLGALVFTCWDGVVRLGLTHQLVLSWHQCGPVPSTLKYGPPSRGPVSGSEPHFTSPQKVTTQSDTRCKRYPRGPIDVEWRS